MLLITSAAEAAARSRQIQVNGREYTIAEYVGAAPERGHYVAGNESNDNGLPQGFLVHQPPHAVTPAHFHEPNQFQVFVDGNGRPAAAAELDLVLVRTHRSVALRNDASRRASLADGTEAAASVQSEQGLYEAQMEIFLDPNNPTVIAQARRDGIADSWLETARKSPIYKMVMEWKVAFPLHPGYRTLPIVWYVPPLSPITAAAEAEKWASMATCRTPVRCAFPSDISPTF